MNTNHLPSSDDKNKLHNLLDEVQDRLRTITEHLSHQSEQEVTPSTEEPEVLSETVPTPTEVAETPITVDSQVSGNIAEALQRQTQIIEMLLQKVDKIEGSIQDFTYKDEINSRLHKELQKYKDGLSKEFITPLLKGIVVEYERAARQYHAHLQKAGQSEDYDQLLKLFKMMMEALLVLLYDYDIEPYEVKEGDEYSPKLHRTLETIETTDVEKDKTIALCISQGFRDVSNDRIFEFAKVNIYKWVNGKR